ncbi:MAG: acyltransferase domain-containing protein, partial [Myxococcales bacterium]|nr:acyltransferase domain-containing protein [Myxococcales bacterium]
AAHVAGALTLEDAMRVAASIGAVYQAAADEGSGRLAIAALSPSALASARVQLGLSGLHLAGYNSPSSTLICGPAAEVERLREELRARDTPCGLLGAVHSHCPAVEPFAAPLAEALAGLTPARARVPMWSTTTGRRVDGAELGASHWIANVRSPVRFVAAVTAAAAAGHRVFVELAPAVTLTPAIEQIVPEAQVVASQLRGEDGRAALASAHARLFALGAVAPPERAQARLYAVSARTDAALRARAADDAAWIEARGELELDALATSSLRGRALFKRRAAVIARSREELCEALTALAAGRDDPRRLDGAAPEHGAAPEVELVFTDVGAWARTVHTALEALPAFASTLLQARALTRTLLRAVGRDPERADAEPRLVTLHVALGLAAQWRAWGLAPIACRGVGVGALAAAHVRGDLTLKEALYAAVIGAPPPPSPTARAGALALRVGALDPATDEVACLRPDCAPDEALQRALAALLVRGVALDVDAIARDLGGATIDLPGYRFERQRCWMAEGDAAGVAAAGDRTNRRASPEPRPPTRAGSVRELVLAEVARVLELPAASLDDDTPLAARGLDSLLAVELTEALSEACGRELPAGLLYERPTVAALCQALAEHTTQGTGEPSPSLAAASDEPIAIVGAACRLPGGVASPDELWALLEGRVDAITEVPAERWPIDAYYDPDPDAPGKTYCRWGGFLTDIDRFDAGFFHVSAREAAAMDPQHRLLLEVCWEALEDAAIPIDRLRGAPAGVFVGISTADYSLRARAAVDAATEAYGGIGNLASVAAGRVAYTLGLAGPAMAVDTACSSSLLAVHLACQSLRAGECELALAGGVNLLLEPALTVSFSRLKVLARDGRCRAFDARASGYVRSEGCGVVALRRLSDARARGDRVLAVIRGSAVNHDGRSNGLTAPSGAAQVAVLREALARAGLTPAEVDCVEAHGTGT